MAGSVCTPCLFHTQGPHLSPSQPSSRCLTSILGKSNLQFAGMTISLTISTSSLNLLASDCKQVRLKPACSWRCCCVSFSQELWARKLLFEPSCCQRYVWYPECSCACAVFPEVEWTWGSLFVGLRIMQTFILRMSILIDCHLYFYLMLILFAFKSVCQCVSCIGVVNYIKTRAKQREGCGWPSFNPNEESARVQFEFECWCFDNPMKLL